jgi:single-strand DNA-binding protein
MYQKIIIVGNLGNDPEMRYLPNGTAVTSFSVATSRKWTDSQTGQPVEETTWFRVSVWGKQAETSNQYLAKGRKVLVEGTLTPDLQTGGPKLFTKRDGTAGSSFEVKADNVKFLSGREEGDGGDGRGIVGEDGQTRYTAGKTNAATLGGGVSEEDDIPF